MGELSIQRSFLFSIIIHLLLFIFFSLLLLRMPPQKVIEPVVIELSSDTAALSRGIPDSLLEPVPEKSPTLEERVTRPQEKQAVPEKAMPARQPAVLPEPDSRKPSETRPATSDIKETRSRQPVPDQIQPTERIDPDLARESGSKPASPAPSASPARDLLADSIDQALAEDVPSGDTASAVPKGDPLSDARWSDRPRKTVFFPDIESKIPPSLRKKGMGYSITARIRFDKNGLATRVDIITSSGEAAIDSLFNSELRKIRVEAVGAERSDEITKTFTISVR